MGRRLADGLDLPVYMAQTMNGDRRVAQFVASGLTHPDGRAVAVPSLVFRHFFFVRHRLHWKGLAPAALPCLADSTVWSVNFLQSSGNSAGRLCRLKTPLVDPRRGITDRWLPEYGVTQRARRGLVALVFCALIFPEGAKQSWYLSHATWQLAAAVVVSWRWLAWPQPGWRVLRNCVLADIIRLQCGHGMALITERKYECPRHPAFAAFRLALHFGPSVISSAEQVFCTNMSCAASKRGVRATS